MMPDTSRFAMRAGFITCVAMLFLAAGVLAPGPAHAQPIVMKFSTQTQNDMQHEYIKVYKTELEKRTNNRITVEVYPGAQLGSQQRQSEGLRIGSIEAAIGPAELFAGVDPRFQVLAMAGLYKDVEHARRVLTAKGPELVAALLHEVEAATRNLGVATLLPRVSLVCGSRILDLSDARRPEDVAAAAARSLEGQSGTAVAVVAR